MDKFFENEEEVPRNEIQEIQKMNDGDNDEPKKKVMKLEGQVNDGGDERPVEAMMLGSATTATGQFVQLLPELLTTILTNLDKKNDLLASREVNSTWMTLTIPILRQQERYKIRFNGEYYLRTVHGILDLVRLNDCLKNSKKLFGSLDFFPCVRFVLSSLRLEEENVQKFFDLYGPSIQSLQLDRVEVSVEDGQLRSLSRLLTQQAPNIRHIDLMYLNIRSGGGVPAVLFDNKQTIKLPHLQSLDQYSLETELGKTIMKEIMEAADNLRVYNLQAGFQNVNQLDFFVSTGKMRTLKKVWMEISEKKMELWEKFAAMQPTLESLTIIHYSRHDSRHASQLWSRAAANVINQVFESSKETLTTLDLCDQQEHIPELHFPVLKKVKQLRMSCHFGTTFPHGQMRLSTIFPKVCEVTLNLFDATSIFWTRFMENNLPSVHTLIVYNFQNNAQDLSRLFPNLRNLVVHWPKLDVVGGIFEHMKGLESLEFSGVNDYSRLEDEYYQLDKVLTGFSSATCLRLAKSEEKLEDGEVEKLRENPSILELTGLRTLKLSHIVSFKSWDLSRVSGIWAFQKMPQVKVTVTADRRYDVAEDGEAQAALDAIAPFVHSVGFE